MSDEKQNPQRLLADDHEKLDRLLVALINDVDEGEIGTRFARLDLFWARLAVHIRAEHLHLFPAVLEALKSDEANYLAGLSLAEAESAVALLRADHDFFMRQLAGAVALVRDQAAHGTGETLTLVRNIVRGVESRLKTHNEIEESRIYPSAMKLLNEQQQVELAREIRAELVNRPRRFSPEEWLAQQV